MRSYDPTEVNCSFNSVPVEGFGPETFIKAARNEDGWSLQMGNSGTGARSRNPNKSGRVTFTLLASEPVNDLLQAIAIADELRGEGVGELLITDRNTAAAQVKAQNAWIVKIPDFERQKASGTIDWVIEAEELTITHDGLIDTP